MLSDSRQTGEHAAGQGYMQCSSPQAAACETHAMQGREAIQPPVHGLAGPVAQVASRSSCLLRLTDLHTLVLGHHVLCKGHTSQSGAAKCTRWCRQACRTSGDAAARAVTAKGLRTTQGAAHLMRQQGRCLHWCSCRRLQHQRTSQDRTTLRVHCCRVAPDHYACECLVNVFIQATPLTAAATCTACA